MANVNGFRMDDIIDLITDSQIKVDVDELFAIMKAAEPTKLPRVKIDLINLLNGDGWQ